MDVDYKGFLTALGDHIRDLRKKREWSRKYILVTLGINDSQWRKYERGGGLTLESLLKVAACFNMSLVELLDGLGEFPKKSVRSITDGEQEPRKAQATLKAPAKAGAKRAPASAKERSQSVARHSR